MSEPHTLASATLMSMAPGSGSGTGYSRISKGLPVPWKTASRPVSAMALSFIEDGAQCSIRPMNITILDDWQDTIRTLPCFAKVKGHAVTVWNDHTKDVEMLAKRLVDTEALCLIRERTPITAPLLERLDRLRIICQVGVFPHVDVEAATKRGVIMSSSTGPGRPSYATAELTWGLVIAAFRRIPQEMNALRAGKWQAHPIGLGLRGKTLGIWGYGKIGAVVAGYGKAFGMNVLAWGRPSTLDKARADGVTPAASKEAFLEQCDVISIHVRLIPETRGMVTQ